MERDHFRFSWLVCDCGCKMFALNRVPGIPAFTQVHELLARRTANKMGSRFIDTGKEKNCPKCGKEIEITEAPRVLNLLDSHA